MNCLEFRRAVGAEPNRISADAGAHMGGCPTCAKYAQEMQRLDGLIKRALDLPAPRSGEFVAPTEAPRRWFALAASLLLTIVVGGVAWIALAPRDALAADIVQHMNHEPDAMSLSAVRVPDAKLDGMLQPEGMKLVEPLGEVSYVQSCWIRRAWVPHVVVQTSGGPVTVIVLPHEHVASTERFDEGGYHGEIMPLGKGSIVVIANDSALLSAVAARASTAIAWQ